MATAARWGTTTATIMPMDEAALLTLTRWLSPAFPVGGFAYSHGLEAAIASGEVGSGSALRDWLEDVLRHGSGHTDAVLLVHALRGTRPVDALAALGAALAASRERYQETMEQGAAFARTVNALTGADRPAAPLPVAVGAAAAPLGLPAERVAALYLQAFAANLVSAAVRLVPLGQTEGQRVLADLEPAILQVAAVATGTELDAIATASFGADMAATAHETLPVRLFKT